MALRQYQRYLIVLIPMIIVGLLIYYFSDIFTYFALGWVISLLGAPLFKLFHKVMNNSMSAILTLIVIMITFSLFMWLLVPKVIQQTRNIANIDYEAVMSNLDEPLEDWNDWLVEKGLIHLDKRVSLENTSNENHFEHDYEIVKVDTTHGANINIFIDLENSKESENGDIGLSFQNREHFVDSVKDQFFQFFDPTKIPALFGTVAGFFGNLLITIVSALFIAFFFLKETGLFTRIIKSAIPDNKEDQIDHAIEDSENLLANKVSG